MNKKILLSLLLAVLVLVSVSAVSAADIKVIGTSFDDIQNAVDHANPGDSIYLNNCTYKVNETNPKPITINTDDLTIYGGKTANDNKYSTLDGYKISQIMLINATNIKIVGVNFVAGNASDGNDGGAITLNRGSSLTVQSCKFLSNDGGAIYAEYAQLNIIDSAFEDNYAYDGGAIYAALTDITVINSNFTQNTANYNGGAIYSAAGLLDIDNCLFKENHARYNGGAVFGTNIAVTNSKFISNTADEDKNNYTGGAIYFAFDEEDYLIYSLILGGLNNSLKVDGCTFSDNKAYYGGAVYAMFGAVDVTDSTFLNNRANYGGAIFNSLEDFDAAILMTSIFKSGNYLNVYDCNFVSNYASEEGGAILSTFNTVIDNSQFSLNIARMGGAVEIMDLYTAEIIKSASSSLINLPSINVLITDSVFNSNRAMMGGAVVFMDQSTYKSEDVSVNTNKDSLTVLNCDFKNNYAYGLKSVGGAILSTASNNIIDNSYFLNNTVINSNSGSSSLSKLIVGSGGAVAVMGNLNVSNSDFDKNKAVKGGAIAVMGTLNIDNCNFADNIANITLDKEIGTSTLISQTPMTYGGVIFVLGSAIIDNSTFYNNTAFAGGALTIYGGANVTSCEFIDNKASIGGAIFSINLIVMEALTATSMNAVEMGIASVDEIAYEKNNPTLGKTKKSILILLLLMNNNNVNIEDCYFEGNIATTASLGSTYSPIESSVNGAGGAILSYGNPLKVTNSYFHENIARSGGAISYNPVFSEAILITGKCTLDISNCGFTENTATYDGGAISINPYSRISGSGMATIVLLNNTVSIKDSLFTDNEAKIGGAISSVGSLLDEIYGTSAAGKKSNGRSIEETLLGNLTMAHVTGSVFVQNTASQYGGAIVGLALAANYNIFEINDGLIGSAVFDVTSDIPKEEIVSYIKSNYDYNFWGLANDVTKFPKNMVSSLYGSLAPANWVVVDIAEPLKGGNVFAVKFVLNDGSELSAAMPSYAAALTVNDKSENIVIEDNVYTEAVDSTGKYNVDVNSIQTEALLASASFNVKTIQMVVTTEVNGTTVTVTVKVAKDATGKVGFHLDQLLGIKYVDVRDGVAVCKYDKLAAGEHTVDVSYQGDDYAYPVSKVAFTVNDPKISAEDVDKFYRGSEQYVVTVVDGTPLAGETVSIFINGVEYTRVTDENGQAKMDINLNPGIYKVTAVYKGETVTNTIVVKSTVLGNDLTKMYCNDSQYYATFLDSEGKVLANTAVWFNINGVIYNRVTDEHGIAGLNINLLPDEYILTAYNSVTGQLFTNMVYVLPQLVQLKTVDNLVALEVLDKSGKPVKAGEEVLLNFNGKVLSATSDANGMVFFADPSFDGTFATAYYDGCLVNVNLSTPKAEEIIW